MKAITQWKQWGKKTLQTMITSQNLHTIVVESKHKQMMKAQEPQTKVVKTKRNIFLKRAKQYISIKKN